MATKIFNTDTREVVELQVISDGQDFLFEAIESVGAWSTEEDASFEMNGEDLAWWTRWAEREQAILDAAEEIGEEAIEKLAELSCEYDDMELLQDKEEEYLGL